METPANAPQHEQRPEDITQQTSTRDKPPISPDQPNQQKTPTEHTPDPSKQTISATTEPQKTLTSQVNDKNDVKSSPQPLKQDLDKLKTENIELLEKLSAGGSSKR